MSILSTDAFFQLFDVDRIKQLASDSSEQFGTIAYNQEIVITVIAQAEGVVKNTLSLQYTVAQLEADVGVKRITADLAMYYLEARRPPISSEVQSMHKLALELLKQLQEGLAKLTAVDQLLPIGPSEEPTEATASGYFDGGPGDPPTTF